MKTPSIAAKPGPLTLASRWGSGALLVLLVGCAVLTVDVDVYQGPLANHEDIQTEQVAAMAMGAEPLLISLRDKAEAGWAIEDKVALIRAKPWYKPGFVASHQGGQGEFTNEFAIRVNAILSLYADRPSGDWSALLVEARRDLANCRTAYGILHRSNTVDISEFKRLGLQRIVDEQCMDFRHRLANAYRAFLVQTNTWRTVTNIFAIPEATDDFEEAKAYFDDIAPGDSGANACFAALENGNLLQLHASTFFPPTSTNDVAAKQHQSDFINSVARVARSFAESREALAQLWRVNLGLITLLDRRDGQSVVRRQQIAGAASLAANLIETAYLSGLLRVATDGSKTVPPAIIDLRTNLQQYLDQAFFNRPHPYDDTNGAAALRAAVRSAILTAPARVATELALADDYFINEFGDTNLLSQAGLAPALKLVINRRYGLARGATREAMHALDLNDLAKELNLLGDSAEAFARGRLDDGLETLIQNYLQAAHDFHKTEHEVWMNRQRLLDGLVGFAEKIKFLADNQTLVSTRVGVKDWLIYSAELLTFPITEPLSGFGMHRTLRQKNDRIFRDTYDYERAKPYTLVLQAVGNSIISEADELVQRAAYRRSDTNYSNPEWAALKDAVAFLKDRAPTNAPATRLTERLPPGAGTAKASLDVLINALRDIQLAATATGDTEAAAHAKAAIDLATSYRADLAFIRPPSAFLRNSNPATSLRPAASVAWQNMLGRHAIRSIPLIGETMANWGTDVNMMKEIDKQYWQNINRVRVAAAGFTSYAITKDDIGNWYVKSYTGDPSPIIEGAKSLVGYGIADSAARKGAQALGQIATTTNVANPEPSLLESQYAHFAAIYASETTNDATRIYSAVTNLTNRLASAFSDPKSSTAASAGDVTNAVNILTKHYHSQLTNALARLKSSMGQTNDSLALGRQLADLLRGVAVFERETFREVSTNFQPSVTNVISPELRDLVSARLKTVQDYEAAVKVLGESVAK